MSDCNIGEAGSRPEGKVINIHNTVRDDDRCNTGKLECIRADVGNRVGNHDLGKMIALGECTIANADCATGNDVNIVGFA